jgi:hypothetical protein
LHQHHDARQSQGIRAQTFQEDFSAQNRLNAFAASGLVKLDGTKQIAQVGDGQSGLMVVCRSLHHLVNAAGGIDNGKLGMEAQVNKHGPIVEAAVATVFYNTGVNKILNISTYKFIPLPDAPLKNFVPSF